MIYKKLFFIIPIIACFLLSEGGGVEYAYSQEDDETIPLRKKIDIGSNKKKNLGDSGKKTEEELDKNIDPIAENLFRDGVIALNFISLTLDDPEEESKILDAIVRALLIRGDSKNAIVEVSNIKKPRWKIRSYLAIYDYFEIAGLLDLSRKYISLAFDVLQENPELNKNSDLLLEVARRFSSIRDYNTLRRVINKLETADLRIDAMIDVSKNLVERSSDLKNNERRMAFDIIEQAFSEANELSVSDHPAIATKMIRIANYMLDMGNKAAANVMFLAIRKKFLFETDDHSLIAVAKSFSGLLRSGDRRQSMSRIHSLPNALNRSMALASVARALWELGRKESALPLFTLAIKDAADVLDPKTKLILQKHLVEELSKTLRYADAFDIITRMNDKDEKIKALLLMSSQMVKDKQYKDAIRSVKLIPDIGMRALVYIAVVEKIHAQNPILNQKIVDQFIFQALQGKETTHNYPYLIEAIRRILIAQTKFGSPEFDEKIFERARDLTVTLNDKLLTVKFLSDLSKVQHSRGLYHSANKTLNQANVILHENFEGAELSQGLAYITKAQVALGDYIKGFYYASLIPFPEELSEKEKIDEFGRHTNPKYVSLRAVAVAAAKDGDLDLAIRAARQIYYLPAQAEVLSDIAIAADEKNITKRQKQIIEKILASEKKVDFSNIIIEGAV